jgi:hypothetical protein
MRLVTNLQGAHASVRELGGRINAHAEGSGLVLQRPGVAGRLTLRRSPEASG